MIIITVKRGNTKVLQILCQDENGDAITTLGSAEAIKFHVKESKNSTTAKIAKSLTDGIAVDTPTTGYVQITLLPTDTDITPRNYFIGLEIKWDDDNVYEADIVVDGRLVDTIEVVQDVVTT